MYSISVWGLLRVRQVGNASLPFSLEWEKLSHSLALVATLRRLFKKRRENERLKSELTSCLSYWFGFHEILPFYCYNFSIIEQAIDSANIQFEYLTSFIIDVDLWSASFRWISWWTITQCCDPYFFLSIQPTVSRADVVRNSITWSVQPNENDPKPGRIKRNP